MSTVSATVVHRPGPSRAVLQTEDGHRHSVEVSSEQNSHVKPGTKVRVRFEDDFLVEWHLVVSVP